MSRLGVHASPQIKPRLEVSLDVGRFHGPVFHPPVGIKRLHPAPTRVRMAATGRIQQGGHA